MKKWFLGTIVLFSMLSVFPAQVKYDYYQDLSESIKTNKDFEKDFYKTRIPANYADAFLYYTEEYDKIDSTFRMKFYSIMVHESGNFKRYVNKNPNGSVDLGPSQLNSYNIDNAAFMRQYKPKDKSHITTLYCYYMVVSINYYWDLIKTYGDKYALYAYNGGPKAARIAKNNIQDPRFASLVRATTSYNRNVRKNVKRFSQELREFIKVSRTEHITELKQQYSFIAKLKNSIPRHSVHQGKKFVSDVILYFIRKKQFREFQPNELVIKLNIITGTFQYQFTQGNIA